MIIHTFMYNKYSYIRINMHIYIGTYISTYHMYTYEHTQAYEKFQRDYSINCICIGLFIYQFIIYLSDYIDKYKYIHTSTFYISMHTYIRV
jgi:hypothetical protein